MRLLSSVRDSGSICVRASAAAAAGVLYSSSLLSMSNNASASRSPSVLPSASIRPEMDSWLSWAFGRSKIASWC